MPILQGKGGWSVMLVKEASLAFGRKKKHLITCAFIQLAVYQHANGGAGLVLCWE